MRIHIDRWPLIAKQVGAEILIRWPWLTTSMHGSTLYIEATTHHVNGSLSLQSDPSERRQSCMMVHAQISGAESLCGTLSEAEAKLHDYRAVLDALHYATAQLAQVRIYVGAIPCDACRGEGNVTQARGFGKKRTSTKITCEKCNGTGESKAEQP